MVCLANVLKISLQEVLKISWRRLQNVLKMSWRRPGDVLKTSWRRLEDVLKIYGQDKYIGLDQDVLKTSWRRKAKANIFVLIKTSWRRLLKTKTKDVFKTSSRRLHQDECLLGRFFFLYTIKTFSSERRYLKFYVFTQSIWGTTFSNHKYIMFSNSMIYSCQSRIWILLFSPQFPISKVFSQNQLNIFAAKTVPQDRHFCIKQIF